jgi:iron complex transport system substrate-binding protein
MHIIDYIIYILKIQCFFYIIQLSKMNKIFLLILSVAIVMNSCTGSKREVSKPRSAETVLFTDSTGRRVAVPAAIRRVVPSGTTAQMYMLAIAPELLCSLSGQYSAELAEFIPEVVQKLPVTGQLYGNANMNPETIAGIAPDLILDVGEPKQTAKDDMENISKAVAVPAVHIAATLHSTPDAFRNLGRLLGKEARGEELARFCERVLTESENLVRQAEKKPSALYCLGPTGTNVIAAGSFQGEVIDMMTHNAAVTANPSAGGTGNEANPEQIFLWDPDIIIFAADSIYETAKSNRLWQPPRAIRDGNYFRSPSGPYNWLASPPSINRYLGMLWLGKLLYNAEYDLHEMTAEYYRLFYGYNLSREHFNTLTAGALR